MQLVRTRRTWVCDISTRSRHTSGNLGTKRLITLDSSWYWRASKKCTVLYTVYSISFTWISCRALLKSSLDARWRMLVIWWWSGWRQVIKKGNQSNVMMELGGTPSLECHLKKQEKKLQENYPGKIPEMYIEGSFVSNSSHSLIVTPALWLCAVQHTACFRRLQCREVTWLVAYWCLFWSLALNRFQAPRVLPLSHGSITTVPEALTHVSLTVDSQGEFLWCTRFWARATLLWLIASFPRTLPFGAVLFSFPFQPNFKQQSTQHQPTCTGLPSVARKSASRFCALRHIGPELCSHMWFCDV